MDVHLGTAQPWARCPGQKQARIAVQRDPSLAQILGRPTEAEASTMLPMFLRNFLSLRVSCLTESARDP